MVYYSTFTLSTCSGDPTGTITASNFCEMGQPATITISSDGECDGDIDLPDSCYATEAPTVLTRAPTPSAQGGRSERNMGDSKLPKN